MSSNNNLVSVYDKDDIDSLLLEKLGFDQTNISKFNFAQITKTIDGIQHVEYWILSNAYYDYDNDRFVKTDLYNTSFGIQIQASGVYPGEHALGYNDIMGINIWRCPAWKNAQEEWIVYMDTTTYDYTDMIANNWIGAEHRASEEWREFAVATGWNNNLMTDSFGGVTIGGAGFEIDGNGIFPYTRLTSSVGYVNGTKYYMLGLLDNAYHGSTSNWDCDDNKHYSWFAGLISPPLMNGSSEVYLTKDLSNAKFVIMYNDTPENSSDIHDMDTTKWHIIMEANMTSIKGMVNGTLTTLGTGGGGGSITVDDEISSSSENPVQNKVIYTALQGKASSTHSHAIADLPTASLTNGDTTHVPTCDTVYDALALKESTSNKTGNMTTDTGSTSKYPTVKAVQDYIDSVIGDADDWLTS